MYTNPKIIANTNKHIRVGYMLSHGGIMVDIDETPDDIDGIWMFDRVVDIVFMTVL